MNRIQVYLDDPTYEAVVRYAKECGTKKSTAAAKILTRHFHEMHSTDRKSKDHELLLRCNNIVSQVLRCVYDADKVSINSTSSDNCLKLIREGVREGLKKRNEAE